MPEALARQQMELDDFIAAYEEAQQRPGGRVLRDFLPPADHPLYREALRELIRVDLEFCWQRRQRKTVMDYAESFPEILDDVDIVEAIAFEEFRQRRRAGEKPPLAEFAQRYRVDVAELGGVPLLRGKPATEW